MKPDKFSKEDVEFIFNQMRQSSVKWKGRAECLRLARKKVLEGHTKKGKPIYKYHWQCAICSSWYRNEADMEVDHIVEIGGATSFNGDWNEMIRKIFPRPVKDHLQALCVFCHLRKTKNFMSAQGQWERRK